MIKNLVLLVLASFAVGCSHLAATIPTPIVENPEISGKEKGAVLGLNALAHAGARYEATTDASNRPPNLAAPQSSHALASRISLYADLIQRFRLQLGGDVLNGGYIAGVQLQLIGSGRAKAKDGSFSLSAFGHAGQNSPSKSGDQAGAFGPGGNPWSGTLQADWHSYGASLGIRVSDSTLLYAGGAKQFSLYQTRIDHTQGVAPNGIYHSHEHGEGIKGQLGIAWASERGHFFIAGDYSEMEYDRAPEKFITSVTTGFEVDFK